MEQPKENSCSPSISETNDKDVTFKHEISTFKKKIPTIFNTSYPVSCIFIVAYEFWERFSHYSMRAVLALFFTYFLQLDEGVSVAIFHATISIVFAVPVFGIFLIDSWLGHFKSIIYISVILFIGSFVMVVAAVPSVGGWATHIALTIVAQLLIAIGCGGTKASLPAFGGDQFEENQAIERDTFFSAFFLARNLGKLISILIAPLLRDDVDCFGEDCYSLVFTVSSVSVLIAVVQFLAGMKTYRKNKPQGNISVDVCKCITYALKNCWKQRHLTSVKKEHWLDWASEKYPEQLIKEIKMVLPVLLLFIPVPVFWALYDQQGSRWTLQATTMYTDFGIFAVKPDQMQMLGPMLILVFIPLFDWMIYPAIYKCKINFTPLRRMAAGMLCAALAFSVAAIVEVHINETTMHQPQAKESLIQILNMADDKVNVTLQGKNIFGQPISAFQDPDKYTKLNLEGSSQTFQFSLEYEKNLSVCAQTLHEKTVYSLAIYKDGTDLKCVLLEDLSKKPEEGLAAVRFINALGEDMDITVDNKEFGTVSNNYGISEYRTLHRGTHKTGVCKIGSRLHDLNLGLMDFGASYTIVITGISENHVLIKKTEDIPTNNVHVAWQIPQYALMTAADVLFSVTGTTFSYSQAPASMKTILQAVWSLTVTFGNIIVLAMVQVGKMTQWVEFTLFSALMFIIFVIFSVMAHFYKYVNLEDLKKEGNRLEIYTIATIKQTWL